MKVHIPSIPEGGKQVNVHEGLEWVQHLVAKRFADFCAPDSKLNGELQLLRTNNNVTLQGEVHLQMKPNCDRCGKAFARSLDIPLHRHMVPYFEKPDEAREEGEEVELSEEDLDFSCYHGDEIDLSDIVAEEVFLALPMGFHCQEDCKGLCPRCGTDLNEGPCACPSPAEDSPFSVLKEVKFPSRPS